MSKPVVIITGAGGFIGGGLARFFAAKGWKVRGLVHSGGVQQRLGDKPFHLKASRRGDPLPRERLDGVEYSFYDLRDEPDGRNFEGAQFLVHCAYVGYEKNKDADRINIDGAKALIAQCRRHGVKFVFLSSFSAHGEAESHYGRAKLQIESLTDPTLDLVLRPGLVLGREGLFASLSRLISTCRVIPLVGGGRQPVQTIALDDLCSIIAAGLEKGICGVYNVADPQPITLRELYAGIAGREHRRVVFVPVPAWLVYRICRGAETIGLPLPVSSESVLGLKHLRGFETGGDLAVFGVKIKSFGETLGML